MSAFSFRIKKQLSQARLTELSTPHGRLEGPFFQFVATNAAIRGLVFSEDLEAMGVQIVLANAYHLHLKPGEERIAASGGLHNFMQWTRPIITDSGGYQIFSLGATVRVDDEAVTFRSPSDGALHRISPEDAIAIQTQLGADIIMPLDICTPYGASYQAVSAAVEQTTAWAKRCQAAFRAGGSPQALYGIVQGGLYPQLRQRSAAALQQLHFFGYSIGGELREGKEKQVVKGVGMTIPHLPVDCPRYLMGSGSPGDIIGAVRLGVDQFDCVWPIRNARHGHVYYDLNTDAVRQLLHDPERPIEEDALYRTVNIYRAAVGKDQSIFSPDHPVIRKPYTKAYVHHLFSSEAPSGFRLAVLHNIYFYVQLMQTIRQVLSEA